MKIKDRPGARFGRLDKRIGYKALISISAGLICFIVSFITIEFGLSIKINLLASTLFGVLAGGFAAHFFGRRMEAERLTMVSEANYRNLFKNINDLYTEVTADGTIVTISPSVEEILGYSARELIGTKVTELYFDREQRPRMLDELLEKKRLVNYEVSLMDKSGRRHYLWYNLEAIRDADGQVRVIGAGRDVTQYLEARAEQEQSDRNYKLLFDRMLNGFFIIEPVFDENRRLSDIRFVEVNPAFEYHSGKKADQVLGKTWFEIYGFRNRCLEVYEKVFLTGKTQPFLSHIPDLNDKYFSANAFRINENQVGVVFNNITERVKAERELKLREEKYRLIFENIQDLYYEARLEGTILEVSPSIRNILGYEPEEAVGEDIRLLYADSACREKVIEEITTYGKINNFEIKGLTKDGKLKTMWVNAQLITDVSGKEKIIGMARDVTDHLAAKARQEEAEYELRRITASLEAIIESTDDLVWSVDAHGYNIYSNTAMRNHMKASYNAVYGSGVHPRDVFVPELAEAWVGYYERTLKEGRYQLEYKTAKGDKDLEISFNPIYKDGEVSEISVFAKDITKRKQAELEILKLNAGLEQRVAERTSELQAAVCELEAFTYTVSHDLKSPLRAIDAYSRIMLEDYPEQMEGEIGEIAGHIKNISRDMIALINKLLQYSTTVRLDMNKKSININELISMIFNELTAALPERKIELVMETKLPYVKADKVLLKQVVYNVISNAIKFTKTRETAIIKVGHTVEKNEVVVYIKDNGVGFDMASSGKLFGIFQRLHAIDEFEGTGIGLATVRKIMHKHGGRTWIEGEPDKGATVYFTLPASGEQLSE